MNSKHQIHQYATGGTIDSKWDPTKDTSVPNEHSIIPDVFKIVRLPKHEVTHEVINLKDSRDMSISMQKEIAAKVAESGHKNVILTVGTYLMADIANEIYHHPAVKRFVEMGKQVVVTGSTIPINKYLLSDGVFNLGMSTAIFQENEHIPVMIVMSGLCLDVSLGVKKDLTTATFSNTNYDKLDVLNYEDFTLIPVGGSIDFELNGLDGLKPAASSYIPNYLRKNVNVQRAFSAINLAMKDSRSIDENDFKLIVEAIKESKSRNILITTGLYKIQEIQNKLNVYINEFGDKRIVLTGSRLPLITSDINDAAFNLGYALGKMGFLKPGVHVALNGTIVEENESVAELVYTPEERAIIQSI